SLQQIHTNIHMFWQERPAPTARTERAYWCQRQKWRFKRQNGTLRRKIVGRGTRRRRDHDAIANEFVQSHLAVNRYPDLGGLIRLTEQGNFVDRQSLIRLPEFSLRNHEQRANSFHLRSQNTFRQIFYAELVHKEADRAAIHAIDRSTAVHEVAKRLQHGSIAAKRDDDIRIFSSHMAVAGHQLFLGDK